MRVGVSYSDNPDTHSAGIQAARDALTQAGAKHSCDFVLLFSTSRHDSKVLHDAVSSVIGHHVPIVGGGAVGTIANQDFGYAGDQIGLAAIWLEGIHCDILAEDGLLKSEKQTGERLGKRLADVGTKPDSPVLLFYDGIDRTKGDVRLLMATPLLEGIEKGLGFLPNLVGAGLQGDYACTPIKQWAGHNLVQHQALALAFGEGLRIDSAVMHGCQPATGYYTVTKAEKQMILEIDGQPALKFIENLIGSGMELEEFAFFLIFGINKGGKWDAFNEENYASRLVLGIDKARNGIIMFEPDMEEGTRFQLMHRSINLDYMSPRIEALFAGLGNRKPVFALYIDCAGRAAGYAGVDLEDAYVVQKAAGDKVPLLGIYSGVEIASVMGRPRALDWTGVFCLFSVSE